MISYKKINILDLRVTEEHRLYNKDDEFNIKSPIILYKIKEDNILELITNKYSDTHNLFLNICGYIDRLFKIQDIKSNLIINNNVIVNIIDNTKFYDENSKLVSKSNFKKEGKAVCSFNCEGGKFNLNQILLTK
tara:strand:- start:1954 stop:2355 length:402 start_codon:yes stop_codon:yes gene_type:complete